MNERESARYGVQAAVFMLVGLGLLVLLWKIQSDDLCDQIDAERRLRREAEERAEKATKDLDGALATIKELSDRGAE